MGFSILLRHATTEPCALPCLPASLQFQVDPEGKSLPARRHATTPGSHCSLNELHLSQIRKITFFPQCLKFKGQSETHAGGYVSHAYKCRPCAWLFSTIPSHAGDVVLGEDRQACSLSLFLLGLY